MFFWIVVSIVGILAMFFSFGVKLGLQASKASETLFQSLEDTYEDYVRDYLNDRIVAQDKWDLGEEEFRNNVKKILYPHIEAIFGHINATQLSGIKINFKAKYFGNLVQIAESFYHKRYTTNTILGENDFRKLLLALHSALEADITQKILKLKGGIL